MTAVTEFGTGRILAWKDSIPLHYEYTAGVSGEAFLRGLKDGAIVASKCTRCGEVRLPPRTYCLDCQERARIDVEILHSGRIAALSEAQFDGAGTKLAAGSRTTFGFVTFEGVSGGLIHRILHEGRKAAKVGDQVRALFLPPDQRKGSVVDLEGFRTAPRRPVGND
jgi:uncharacterized OB-fold protein